MASTDGVGTKMVIARDTGRYGTVGIDLVAMCVDDLVCVGAEPLFMLDYIATGKVDPDQVATVVAGVHEGCRQAGCALIGGETAEHAGVMPRDELDLAGFAVGVVEQGTQLGPERVRPGDVVVGLHSPGLRSNGYTLARHVLLERAGLELGDPAWAGADHSVADELLRPSVIYTPPCSPCAARSAMRCTPVPTSRAAASWATSRGRCPATWAPCWRGRPGRSRGCSGRSSAWGRSRRTRWTGSSTAASAWRWCSTPVRPTRRCACWARRGQPGGVIGEVVAGSGVRFT